MRHLISLSIVILFLVNIVMVTRSFKLEKEITKLEKTTKSIKIENLELTKKLSALSSLNYLDTVANYLDFSASPQVMYIEDPHYALAQ